MSSPEPTAPWDAERPTSYDRMIKSALRSYQRDLVAWLVGERPLAVRTVESNVAVAAERLADQLIEAHFEHREPLLLYVEFQSAGGESHQRP